MMYYVIAWAGIIICTAYAYKYVQEVKKKAYNEGFDDGWEAREDRGFELKVDVLDHTGLNEGKR